MKNVQREDTSELFLDLVDRVVDKGIVLEVWERLSGHPLQMGEHDRITAIRGAGDPCGQPVGSRRFPVDTGG